MEPFASDIAAVGKIEAVQKILEVVCRITGLGFSAVARVTETHWVACAVRDEIAFGLKPGEELELKSTICNEIRDSGLPVVIEHVAQDKAFCDHHTPKRYGFQSYISVPIKLANGNFFGTLCAIDPQPAELKSVKIVSMFTLFAELIALHLDSQDRVAASEAALLDERETAKLREQFIAVLGHDLRNPLAAIDTGAQMLQGLVISDEAKEVLEMMRSSASRMAGIIENVLDFARGRLGGGLSLQPHATRDLTTVLRQVVSELQLTRPDRTIHQELVVDRPLSCDSGQLGQLLSNLLANALSHGDAASPIWVRAGCHAELFELSVSNGGATIPPEILQRIFEPFERGNATPGQEGLGLGLYIVNEIAKAHQGTMEVTSSNNQTCFTFRMPVVAFPARPLVAKGHHIC